MEKVEKILKSPVNKFLLWIVMGIIVCLIGMTNVLADEISFQNYDYQIYYDNSGSTVSRVYETWSDSFMAYVSNNITTTANSYGAGVVINSGIPIISGHAYSLSFYFEQTHNIALSSKNRIAIGSTYSNSASNYANGSYNATMLTSKIVGNTTLQFAFTANSSNQFIFIPWTTTSTTTQNYVFTSYIINDLGASNGVSQSDINNSLNSQTNILNQSITNSQNAIIDNQDRNTEEVKKAIDEQYNNCKVNLIDFTPVYNSNTSIFSSSYSGNNLQIKSIGGSTGRIVFKINNIEKNTTYTISYKNYISNTNNSIFRIRAGTGEGDWLSSQFPISNNQEFTFNSGNNTTAYLWFYFLENTEVNVSIYDLKIYNPNYCTNKLDEAENTRKGILGKIGDLISYINPTSENFFVYKLIELLVNALKSLFIPEDLSFLNTFKDTISNKLGFIASIPIQIIDFILDLPNAVFEEVNTLHFPRVNIFGYYFWDDMEIDLTIGKSIFSTIKYLTDLTCIVLCVNTLWKWYHSFTGGDTN